MTKEKLTFKIGERVAFLVTKDGMNPPIDYPYDIYGTVVGVQTEKHHAHGPKIMIKWDANSEPSVHWPSLEKDIRFTGSFV